MVERVGGTIVETNTAYKGKRYTPEDHMQTFKDHGWLDYFPVDLLDAQGERGTVVTVTFRNKDDNDLTPT